MRDNAAPPLTAHNGVANTRYDDCGEARCDRGANTASSIRLPLDIIGRETAGGACFFAPVPH
jgi:hypothetical protein